MGVYKFEIGLVSLSGDDLPYIDLYRARKRWKFGTAYRHGMVLTGNREFHVPPTMHLLVPVRKPWIIPYNRRRHDNLYRRRYELK